MKKFLITILFASMFSPALVFADNKSEKKNDNGNSGKSFQMVQHREKDEKEKKDKREKENKKGEQNNQPKKVNYFLCKTDLGWNVVPLEGIKNKNSNNALGTSCWKLPHGLAKKFKNLTSTTTPDTLAPVISRNACSDLGNDLVEYERAHDRICVFQHYDTGEYEHRDDSRYDNAFTRTRT